MKEIIKTLIQDFDVHVVNSCIKLQQQKNLITKRDELLFLVVFEFP